MRLVTADRVLLRLSMPGIYTTHDGDASPVCGEHLAA